ncbi:MAG: MBL fold metallo-hydrolase [Candidatus Bathyarchaeota archaeon]|nr:MBL fold metallo-hydrolase [Candidatus Bathyarchaeota archaeon]
MHTTEVGKNLFQIDLQTGGFKNLIASYILKGDKTIIVETGPTSSIPNLLLALKELNVKLESVAYVALTHVHIDHAGGVDTLLKELPNAQVIVHHRGAPHLKDPTKLWAASKDTLGAVAEMFGEPQAVPEDRIIVASEGQVFSAGEGVTVKALETAGHAAHNLSFYEPQNEGIFPGDSAGAYLAEFDTVYPTTPPPFRPDIALISLDKLISLNPKLIYYSHFGAAFDAVKWLQNYQTQIKRWLNIVEEAVKSGASDEQIRKAVLVGDETVQHLVPTLKSNPVFKKTLIENTVQGFINFARNPKS